MVTLSHYRGSISDYSFNFRQNQSKILVVRSAKLVKSGVVGIKEYPPFSKQAS